MPHLTRRALAAIALPALATERKSARLDALLRNGLDRRDIPAIAAAVATPSDTIYTGAVGAVESAQPSSLQPDSIFAIASMTKAVTTVAALQLVERGKVSLDEPVARHMPDFANLQVLEGFSSDGKPMLRPARNPVSLRHLLTHTAGFGYPTWDANLRKYNMTVTNRPPLPPLMTEPGTRWEYGTNIDWTGRLVEVISGETLEAYFRRHIFEPLDMKDTSFLLPAAKFPRKVSNWRRQPDGGLKEDPRVLPEPPKSFNGGGGLYSTAPDYVRFLQMILRRGTGRERILTERSVAMMYTNQIGPLGAGKMKTTDANLSADVDFHPGAEDRFTFGFLMNQAAYANGRSAGSLAWAGLYNTFYWVDPKRKLCAVLLMQFLPFCDAEAMGMLRDFEQAVYG